MFNGQRLALSSNNGVWDAGYLGLRSWQGSNWHFSDGRKGGFGGEKWRVCKKRWRKIRCFSEIDFEISHSSLQNNCLARCHLSLVRQKFYACHLIWAENSLESLGFFSISQWNVKRRGRKHIFCVLYHQDSLFELCRGNIWPNLNHTAMPNWHYCNVSDQPDDMKLDLGT